MPTETVMDDYRDLEEQALDIVNAVIGILLALSPRVLGFADATAISSACIVGVAASLVATAALVVYTDWEEFANIALGAWAIAAPWALGFTGDRWALRAHVTAGVLVMAIAGLQLWLRHSRLAPARSEERMRRVRIRR
jgi:hypothetical protein